MTMFKGTPVNTWGQFPPKVALDFELLDKDLKMRRLSEFSAPKKVIITVPSIDTGVCSLMTQRFNKEVKVPCLVISADLPFAHGRFCKAEGVNNVTTLSTLGNEDFGKHYGLLITSGPLAGLLARSVLILDQNNNVIYSELVPEITHEPNYDEALKRLNS